MVSSPSISKMNPWRNSARTRPLTVYFFFVAANAARETSREKERNKCAAALRHRNNAIHQRITTRTNARAGTTLSLRDDAHLKLIV